MIDQTIRHHIFLQRYSSAEIKKLAPALKRIAAKTKRLMRENAAALDANESQRLQSLLADIETTINAEMQTIGEKIGAIVRPLAENELEFYQSALTQQSTVLPVGLPANAAQIVASNATMRLVSGSVVKTETIDSVINTLKSSSTTAIRRAILEDGLLAGALPSEIISNVAAIAGQKTRTNAEAVVRTVVNAVSSEAQQQVAQENANLLEGMKWLSTLDGRTSPVCRDRDGKIYPVGSPVTPPAHYRCRSVMVMVLKKEYRVPGIEKTRSASGVKSGYVSDKTTYQSWLRQQPAPVQRDILGSTRYKLFSKGGLDLGKFVDSSGIEYTIDQLRATNALAFMKAGV